MLKWTRRIEVAFAVDEVMQAVCRTMGIAHIKTSGYQPQGNCVERFHRFLMAALCIHCHEFRHSWDEALPLILYAFRASVSSTTGHSPFYLTYGREAPLPMGAILSLKHRDLCVQAHRTSKLNCCINGALLV